ncbi:MAG: SBBP repeat-containing protein, partial [Armatimonadetes bacterium]|nr:SBBP repeat-containing protein [Armatimonadota bacterium]
AGGTSGTLPGQTSAGNFDAFVRKYDADGNEVWTRQFGGSGSDRASGISVDASGVYVAGSTTGTLPGQTSAGSADAFVVKLSILTPTEAVQQLMEDVVALNLSVGIENSLDAKLDAAFRALADLRAGNDGSAVSVLQAFINAVMAQSGNHIPVPDADDLIASAQAIIDLLTGT